jgi:hypothetical protein
MSIEAIAKAIHDSTMAGIVRGDIPGTEWVFPIIETLHVIFLVLVFGSIAMVDLRLIGLSSRQLPFSKLYREIMPWIWWAFAGAVVFGVVLATGKITDYLRCWQFVAKFVFMALAGVNMLIFHFGAFRHVERWDTTLPVPAVPRLAGALSLIFWSGVVVCGRWIGFAT